MSSWAIVGVFVAGFGALTIAGAWDRSATWDEPIHLTAGYAALTAHDYRVDPSHPPLLRMWAALPILAMASVGLDTAAIDASAPDPWLSSAYGFAHRFMYVENDADRLLGAARAMIVLLGILLGILVFCWARQWLGLLPAAGALALFALEPNLVAHASLVTTDLGLTTFLFGAVYFLWRCCERPTRLNALATAGFTALAAMSKFSAILLVPIFAVLLAAALIRRAITLRMAVAMAALTIATTVAGIWVVYGIRFLPSESPSWAFDFSGTDLASSHPLLADVAVWVNSHRLLPNAYTQGFFYAQSSADTMPSFLAGERSADGWWYYFPVAFLLKTPIALLLLLAVGVATCVARRHALGALPLAFVTAPIAIYLAAAMASGINLGLRHILPIYPFILLLAAAAIQALVGARKRWVPAVLAVLAAGGVAEIALAHPEPLTFFNQLAGGPTNGYRYLADSNLGWGGNLKRLKTWMTRNGVTHVNLAYFGQADPAYYDIDCTHLPGAPGFAVDAVARPQLPGYVVISPTIMQGVYAPPSWRLFYEPFRTRQPVAVIGHSLRVYWVEQWPANAAGAAPGDEEVAAHRLLAEALFWGMRWPDRAVLHYGEYLKHRPADVDARVQQGLALVADGQVERAIEALRLAVAAGPDHGGARLTLARALFGHGDLPGAAEHGERAARLLPRDPDAHDFLGRVRAAEGRFDEALASFRRALQIDPSHREARAHAARLTRIP